MLNAKLIGLCAGLVALFAAPLAASAQDAITAPGQKTIGQPSQPGKADMIPSLAVINSRGATLQGNILTMTDVGSNSIVFADRPFRAAGHVLTKHFLKEWDEGSDSFAKDPPNATISVLSGGRRCCRGRCRGPEIAEARWRQVDLRGDRARRRSVEGNGTRVPVHRLVRRARLRRPGDFVAGGYGGGWHGAWYGHPNYGAVAGAAARRPRRGGGRSSGGERLLSPLRVPLLRAPAAGLRLLSLSALLLRRTARGRHGEARSLAE